MTVYVTVNASDGLKLRAGPGGEGFFASLGTIPNGTQAEMIGQNAEGTWLNVKLPDGRTGWWKREYVTVTGKEPETPSSPNIATTPGEVLLNVPYHSQEDLDAKAAFADCGPCSLRMIIGWNAIRRGQPDPNLTVDAVTKATGIGPKQFSKFPQLIQAGRQYGLEMLYTRPATLDRMQHELEMGRPVLALLHYGSLKKRQFMNFTGGHFVVVVGYNPDEFIIHDPYWTGARRSEGAALRVPRAEFDTAVGPVGAGKAGNMPYQALFVDPRCL
ncbi:MAG: C39 family peptidase [Chloroflexi bacterium]|nr:C39 family peptidase [Chloroflexota bacterium]